MAIDPTGADLKRFFAEGGSEPLVMLNLLRFAEGGRERYAEYARRVAPLLAEVGGEVLYFGAALPALVAESGQAWDAVLLARYPSPEAFARMVKNPAYQAITHLRSEALSEAVLQPTRPF